MVVYGKEQRERHGARKTKAVPAGRGGAASGRRIGNIMRRRGMAGAHARKRFWPRRTGANEAALANLSDRGFAGCRPHTRLAGNPAHVNVNGKRACCLWSNKGAQQGRALHRRFVPHKVDRPMRVLGYRTTAEPFADEPPGLQA